MNCQSLFRGTVNVKSNKRTLKRLRFKFEYQPFRLQEVMMCNFKNIDFCEKEKHDLCATHRQIIRNYQEINKSELDELAKELIVIINSLNDEVIDIEASDAGTFICLAAIYSGKIKNKDIIFHLSSSPINLFNRKLIKNKNAVKNVKINFCVKQESWLRNYESLKDIPSEFGINQLQKINNHEVA